MPCNGPRPGRRLGGYRCSVPEPETIEIRDEMIRLGQLLKLAGLVEDGARARAVIEAGEVTVNGRPELRRGRQLHVGDEVGCTGHHLTVVARRRG